MKLSVSLPDDEVAALDAYAAEEGLPSRSAAVLHAIRRLPRRQLSSAYAAAWEEWSGSDDAGAWAATTGDGLGDESGDAAR